MPHLVARPTTPGKGKLADHQEKVQFLEEENHKKGLPDEDAWLDTLHTGGGLAKDDDSSEILDNGLTPNAQNLGSHAGLFLDNVEAFTNDSQESPFRCCGISVKISFENASRTGEDTGVEAVKELIRQAEAAGLIGDDVLSEMLEEVPFDFDGRSILDRSDALWDRLVLGSIPFDFGNATLEKANGGAAKTEGQDEKRD